MALPPSTASSPPPLDNRRTLISWLMLWDAPILSKKDEKALLTGSKQPRACLGMAGLWEFLLLALPVIIVWDIICLIGLVAHFTRVRSLIMPPFWLHNHENDDIFSDSNTMLTFDVIVTSVDLGVAFVATAAVAVRNPDSLRCCNCFFATNFMCQLAFVIWMITAFCLEVNDRMTSSGVHNAIWYAIVPYTAAVVLRGYTLHIMVAQQRVLLAGEGQPLINP